MTAPENLFAIEDLSDVQCFVAICFRACGWSWEHPRVQTFLEKVAAATGKPCPDRHRLPGDHYRMLAVKLAAMLLEKQLPIVDTSAERLARQLITDPSRQLVGAR